MIFSKAAFVLERVTGKGLVGIAKSLELFQGVSVMSGTGMEFFTSAINTLTVVITVLGAGTAIWGLINLLEGYHQDNSATRNTGARQCIAGGGIIFVAQALIPMLANMF